MYNTIIKKADLPGTSPFPFQISYVELSPYRIDNITPSHIHSAYELFIHISGSITYFVGGYEYALTPGSVIFIPPGEVHRATYTSDTCKFYWITFPDKGNEELFSRFFPLKQKSNYAFTFTKEHTLEIMNMCKKLMKQDASELMNYSVIFRLLDLIISPKGRPVSSEMLYVLDYIEQNFTGRISIKELASSIHMSVNCFERHFKDAYGLSPTQYILRKKLALSSSLLEKGLSVKDAASEAGFNDYSQFIAKFKKHNGITPLKYKKQLSTFDKIPKDDYTGQ
ncbi:MAG: AraC family transcriptional regulator [Clostridia bacterium]|nr:AraC family transcriptional regulator [Clostridia bacterium]